MRTNPLALALVGPALILAATSTHARNPGTVRSPKEAKAIAERDTGGKATSARRIPLNGASGGWEVEVRMPHEDKGWRCIIDADTHMVLRKNRIDQPGRKGKTEGSIRMVEGTR
jgi:Peptidase propeptide and YPEB domain